MRSIIRNGAWALGLSAVLVLGASGAASAAPVTSSASTVKAAAPESVTDVRYRGRGYGRYYGGGYGRYYGGPAIVGGLAAGIIGLGVASALAPRYYYDEPVYYAGPYGYYGPRYYAGPRYYRYGYARERYWNHW